MAHRGRFPADDLLAARLAAGETVRAAAYAAGVSEKTAHRRNANPIFRALVQDLRAGMVRDAAGVLAHGMTAAARTLVELLAHEDPHVKHKAAVSLLSAAAKLRESVEFDERLAALEGGDDEDDEDLKPRPRVFLPKQDPIPDDEDDNPPPGRGSNIVRVVETVVNSPRRDEPSNTAAG